MRSLICFALTLTAIACTKDPDTPEDEGADESETETETGEPVDCEVLGESDCNATPGCFPISGTPISAELDCREPQQFAFCSAQDSCDDAETNYLDPGGGCWWFNADCILGAGGWESNSDQCPDYDAVQMLPECG